MKMKAMILIVTLAVLGLVLIWWKIYKKLPKSLSQMVLGAPEWKIIFAVTLAIYGGTSWFSFIDHMPEEWQWLLWLLEVGLALVAITPVTNKDSIVAHTIAALVAATSITVLAAILNPWVLGLWLLYIIYTLVSDCTHKKLVAELVCGSVLTLLILIS